MGNESTHAGFLNRLDESEPARWYVAQWLSSWGYPVLLPATQRAPKAMQWQEYADQGDILMCQRIEAKQRPRLHFTCAQDFPFSTFIVCGRNSFDRARPKPLAYVILNGTMTHAGIVYSDTSQTWQVQRLIDSRTGIEQDFYLAPLDVVEFQPVEFARQEG